MISTHANHSIERRQQTRGLVAWGLLCLLISGLAAAGCGSDSPGQTGCSSHSDCDTGKVCGAQDKCTEVPCEQCQDIEGVTCHPTLQTCTAVQCESNAECDSPKQCIEGVCAEQECSSNSDCPGDEVCNAFRRCVSPTDFEPQDTGVADTNPEPEDTMSPPEDTGPDVEETGVDATEDTTPQPDIAPSEDTGPQDTGNACGNSCRSDQTCQSGTCTCKNRNQPKQNMCPPQGNQDATQWSKEFCQCVECTQNSECDSAQTCDQGFCKDQCPSNKQCSAGQSGACSQPTPHCVSNCCVECVQSSDCQSDDICVNNTCKPNTGCSQGSCPQGYTCNTNSNQCEPVQSPSGCSSNQDCPQGQVCQPKNGTNQCVTPQSPGGSCGACNSSGGSCTCPGNLTCTSTAFGRACSKCVNGLAADLGGIFTDLDKHKCPNGQTCLLLGSLGNSGGGGIGGLLGALAEPDPNNVCLPQGSNGSN